MSHRGYLRVLWFGVFTAACSTVRVQVPVMRPAEINLRGKSELVIGELQGPSNEKMTMLLKNAISDSGRFKLVNRTHLDQILAELALSQSDLADTDNQKKLGKLMSGSIMLVGTIERSDYEENVDVRDETCTKRENKKEVKYPCVRHTRTGNAQVAVGFDVIDIETAENLKAKRLTCTRSSTTQEYDNDPPRIDGEQLLESCHAQVVAEFMKAIAPWQDYVSAPFQKDSDVPMLELGISYAQRGEWKDAIQKFREGVEFAGSQPGLAAETVAKAHWDLGLAYEYTFQFDEAEAEVKKAYDMSGNDDYLSELNNIKRLREERRKLLEQLGESETQDGGI